MGQGLYLRKRWVRLIRQVQIRIRVDGTEVGRSGTAGIGVVSEELVGGTDRTGSD